MVKVVKHMHLFIVACSLALASICQAQINPTFYGPVQPPQAQQVVQAGGLQQLAPAHTTATVLACADDFIVEIAAEQLTRELCRAFQDRGIKVQANLLGFSDAMGAHEQLGDYLWAIVAGIDVIQTDFPLRLLRAVELHAAMKPAEVPPPQIIAHRGGVVDETLIENNLPAIAESRRRGYYMLEVDIRESLDGHLVVHHDANFNRFYGDERQVADLTWEQIQQIRTATGEPPIDFATFAQACQGELQLMLDVKGPEHPAAFFQEMERILRKNGLLESAMVIGTQQAKSYFLGKAKVGLNLQTLLAAEQAGEPVAERYFLFEHGEDLDEAKVAEALRLGVTVVPSINIFHYAGDGNHWLLARRDIRRLRAQGIEYFQIDSVYEDFVIHAPTAATERVHMNELQMIGTHNSYHVAMPHAALSLLEKRSQPLAQSLDYSHLPLREQLQSLGMRQLELDVFADPDGGRYAAPLARQLVTVAGLEAGPEHDPQGELKQPGLKVLHVQDIDYQTRALTFVGALREVREWSKAHPWHAPILILVEAKDQSIGEEFTQPIAFDEQALSSVDTEIQTVFSPQELITPDLVRGEFATLREAVLSRGWPELESVRGKVLFALDNEGEVRDRYMANSPSLQGKLLFVSVDETHPAAAFRKINDPIANFDKIRAAVEQGFIVRTRADSDTRQARQNDSTQRDRALASGAQYISTDYPVPDQRWSSYRVALPGHTTARPNPVNSQRLNPSRDLDK